MATPRKLVFANLAFLMLLLAFEIVSASYIEDGFVKTKGTGQFAVNGNPFLPNGFNAYWMMQMASYSGERNKVSSAFQQASRLGMNAVRTWAFSDGGYRPLQSSPGIYNEEMFKGLDFVISEARKHGVYLILSLVNNFEDFGGKSQYVQWARDGGEKLSSDDDFFTNDVVKGFYRNHVKTVLTRNNTVTGLAYRDDPTILAWELMNEPRCLSDFSGRTLQAWITEMAGHVKSIDGNHLLEVGIEGFYGESMPERKQLNLGYSVGSDFISNNQVPGIDFATIHAYPEQWLPGSDERTQLTFLRSWIQSHAQDAQTVLGMPLLITEFGKSSALSGCNVSERNAMYWTVYGAMYVSARRGGACAGGLFWQLLMEGMDNLRDGYEIILSECPSTTSLIAKHSVRIASLANLDMVDRTTTVRR